MQPIDPVYTANTISEGERVKSQLQKSLSESCEYGYQGSVTNDTHIKAGSDIDLLTLIEKFYTLESPQKPISPYIGDPVQDLVDLRNASERILKQAFPEVKVDCSGSKSISLSGGSLKRKVDVVASNWFNSNNYANSSLKIDRGVQILDKDKKQRVLNYPFLHNHRIEMKDREVGGTLRKAIRLMKSLKYDSEAVNVSSYDICGIAYNIPTERLHIARQYDLSIVAICHGYCLELVNNELLRNSLDVPNKTRKVFGVAGASVADLQQLTKQLEILSTDILNENKRSFVKLAEARIEY